MDAAAKGERYARIFRKAGTFIGKGNIARAIEVLKQGRELADSLGYKTSTHGVVVTNVDSEGLAAKAGLRRGMLITKVDRQPVPSAAKLKELVEAGSLQQGLLLQVQSPQGGTSFLFLKAN